VGGGWGCVGGGPKKSEKNLSPAEKVTIFATLAGRKAFTLSPASTIDVGGHVQEKRVLPVTKCKFFM